MNEDIRIDNDEDSTGDHSVPSESSLHGFIKPLPTGVDVRSESFGEWFSKAQQALVTVVKWILRRPAFQHLRLDPEDVVQSWYVLLLSGRFANYDPQRSWAAYVFGTLNNVCLEIKRRTRRQRAMPRGYDIAEERFNPFRVARKKDMQRRVREAVDRLPCRLNRAVAGELNGVSPEKAAEAEGTSVANMYVRRHRGRKRLRGPLDDFRDLDL